MLFVCWAIVTLVAVVWAAGVFVVACAVLLNLRYR